MRISFSTNAYINCPIEEAIRRIAAIGYEGIELLADVPHAWPAGLLEVQKRSIRNALADHGLALANVNAFMMRAVGDVRQPYWHPSWLEPDGWYRQVRVEHTKRAIELAAELGAPSVSTEPGGPLPDAMSYREGLERFARELRPVLELAERCGVWLLIEPEPGLLIERPEQYLELLELVNSPTLGVNLDVGHVYCVGLDPAEAVTTLADHIRHVHLEDIAPSRVHRHLVPGEGAIEFESVFEALRSAGYDGWITVELYPYADRPDEAARRAWQRIEPLLRRRRGKGTDEQ